MKPGWDLKKKKENAKTSCFFFSLPLSCCDVLWSDSRLGAAAAVVAASRHWQRRFVSHRVVAVVLSLTSRQFVCYKKREKKTLRQHWPPAGLYVAVLTFADIGSGGVTLTSPTHSTSRLDDSYLALLIGLPLYGSLKPAVSSLKGHMKASCRRDRPALTSAGAGEPVGWSPAHPPSHRRELGPHQETTAAAAAARHPDTAGASAKTVEPARFRTSHLVIRVYICVFIYIYCMCVLGHWSNSHL